MRTSSLHEKNKTRKPSYREQVALFAGVEVESSLFDSSEARQQILLQRASAQRAASQTSALHLPTVRTKIENGKTVTERGKYFYCVILLFFGTYQRNSGKVIEEIQLKIVRFCSQKNTVEIDQKRCMM